jgi:hypothetical protein
MLTGEESWAAAGGSVVELRRSPAGSGDGDEVGGVRRTAAIPVVSSASFPASPFGDYGRMEADGAAVLRRRFPAAAGVLREGKEVKEGGGSVVTEVEGKRGGSGWRTDPALELGRAAMAVAVRISGEGFRGQTASKNRVPKGEK